MSTRIGPKMRRSSAMARRDPRKPGVVSDFEDRYRSPMRTGGASELRFLHIDAYFGSGPNAASDSRLAALCSDPHRGYDDGLRRILIGNQPGSREGSAAKICFPGRIVLA